MGLKKIKAAAGWIGKKISPGRSPGNKSIFFGLILAISFSNLKPVFYLRDFSPIFLLGPVTP